jgi:beta-lactamase regulating signal transducer with metallopeptidase domain
MIMASMSDVALLLSQTVELSLLVKATIILLAGLTITQLTRTARASVRHLVIAASFAALIVLPLLLAAAPAMTIDVPVTPSPGATPAIAFGTATVQPSIVVDTAPASMPWRTVSIGDALRALWLAGAIAFLVPVAAVLWKLSMIRRTALPTTWRREEIAELARERGVSKPVDDAELRRALMHELEHIQRGDWLMQILARAVAACYWFHPMVWMAWRRLCLEAERSCDDAVVLSEERTDYAEQLVTLAQRMSATPVQPLLGMANRSDLSTRVTAVLDDRLRRGRAGFALAAGTIAAAAVIVVTVAPVRAVAREDAAAVGAAEQSSRRGSFRPGERRARALDQELYEAALAGDLAGVREMIEAGANANAVISGDGSPLIAAARSGTIQIAQYLLDHGANANQPVPGDGSPLIVAAQTGRIDQVALLVQRGADVNLAVPGDENPLMGAAEGGRLEIVKFLVEKGADIHARIWNERYDGGGEWRTALSQARRNRHTAVVQYLESLGARE